MQEVVPIGMTWLAFTSDSALPIVALLALVALVVVVLARKSRSQGPQKRRIVIHPKQRVKLFAQGKKNCPACHDPLNGLPLARCTRDPNHVIHAMCKEFVRGKCPECNGQIA